jgi:hypothetical protein
MIADLIGFTAIAFLSLMTLLIAIYYPGISKIIVIALTVRLSFLLVGHYIIPLPDSGADAMGFEWGAWNMAKNGFINAIKWYPGPNEFFHQWIISIPYSLLGRSVLLMQSISLFFGLYCVLLGWLLSKKLWGNYVATQVGWTLALFPPLVLYSVLPLREVFCSFFLLVAMYGIVNWYKIRSYKSIFISILGFTGATFFHGVLFIGGIVFSIIILLENYKASIKILFNKRLNLKALIFLILLIIFYYYLLSNKITFPYFGTLEKLINLDWLRESINVRLRGEASYPDWIAIKSNTEFIYKSFVRMLYFLFSPFPWNIEKLSHLLGMFDSFLYMILAYLIFNNRETIWKDSASRTIMIILLCYIFVYGLGVSNFGAGVRHRSKFVIIMILLAAPLIPRFIFFKEKKLNKIS